jgi:hypothetical protein
MVAIYKFASTCFPLGVLFFAMSVSASPAIAPAQLEKRITEASLQNRWDIIFKQVGRNGMQVLCQAILPHATATKTGVCPWFSDTLVQVLKFHLHLQLS